MYSRIKNPQTNRFVNINSTLGKRIINNYLNQLGGTMENLNDNNVISAQGGRSAQGGSPSRKAGIADAYAGSGGWLGQLFAPSQAVEVPNGFAWSSLVEVPQGFRLEEHPGVVHIIKNGTDKIIFKLEEKYGDVYLLKNDTNETITQVGIGGDNPSYDADIIQDIIKEYLIKFK